MWHRASVVRSLTDAKTSDFGVVAIDDSGSLVVVVSSADPFGVNSDHDFRLLALTGPASGAEVPLPGRVAIDSLSVTDDGTWIYFVSPDDLVGGNVDLGRELFRVQPDGSNLTQITSTLAGGGGVLEAIVSGGGSNVLLLGTIDPLGSNLAQHQELFVLNLAGGTYTQLTSASGIDFSGFDISDDGLRIVFSSPADLVGANADGSSEIYTVFANGNNLLQRTNGTTSSPFTRPVVSGNGLWMACQSDGIYARPYTGAGTFAQITSDGSLPTITDDGSLVYYQTSISGQRDIAAVPAAGGIRTQITDDVLFESVPVVSGDGSTIAFFAEQFQAFKEVGIVDSGGSNRATLVSTTESSFQFFDSEPHISSDGERIVFRSTYDPIAGVAVEFWDVFGIDADGSDLERLVSAGSSGHPMLSGDGNSMIFWSDRDLVGGNACQLPQLFGADANGGNVLQLTSSEPTCNVWVDHPVLARNADLVVYQEFSKLFAVPRSGGSATPITDDGNGFRKHPRVSADGLWTVYHSETDNDGLNPSNRSQIFRARTDGSFVERLTADQNGASFFPDISGDGQLIVYESSGNPLGANSELNSEIFLFDAGTGTTTQLTTTTSGRSSLARVSADGMALWFRSSAPLSDSPGDAELYHMLIGSGVIERVSGLADPLHGQIGMASFRDNPGLEIDAAGDRAVFSGSVDATGSNPDRNIQLFLVDLAAAAAIHVGAAAPTLVSWDVEPGPWRYDVIRGDVADLSGGGGTIDLGAVVCIEDESLDERTVGDEDVLQPSSGQVLFYLYRGAEPGGPGSWGVGSDGSTRVPGSGDCPS